MRRWCFAFAALASIACLDAGAIEAVVVHGSGAVTLPNFAFAGDLLAFEERQAAEHGSWEPTIGFGPDGTAYFMATDKPPVPTTGVGAVDELGGLQPIVLRSQDDGRTWQDISPRLLIFRTDVPPVDQVTDSPTISGDPFLRVDESEGRVYAYNQQAYVYCDDWAVSTTRGDSWRETNTCVASTVGGDSWGDHPQIAIGAARAHATTDTAHVIHFCTSSGCRASFDGAATWTDWTQPFADCDADLQLGHIKTAPDGTLYVPRKACGGAMIAVSRDDGATWRDGYVDRTAWTQAAPPDTDISDHDGAVAVDASGNVFYFWLGTDRLPYLAVSRDLGLTWSAPLMVARPGVTYALFPEIVAGADGRIAFTYLGTDSACACRDDPDAVWNMYVGMTIDALDASPVFATATAHAPDDPIRRGPCINFRCYVAPGPEGNGVLTEAIGDFVDLQINPVSGAIWAAYGDLCNGACAAPTGTSSDPASSRASVGVQVAGEKLGEVASAPGPAEVPSTSTDSGRYGGALLLGSLIRLLGCALLRRS